MGWQPVYINVPNGSIGTEKIKPGSIVPGLIAAGAITANAIAADAITVGTAAIQDGAIVNAMIGRAAIDNAKIADLAVTGAKIANATITDANIHSLNAAKLTAGYIDVDRLAANSITASKMVLTDATNCFPDPTFSDPAVWDASRITEGKDGARGLRYTANGESATTMSETWPVKEGQNYQIAVWVKTSVAVPANRFGVSTACFKADGTAIRANTWIGAGNPVAIAANTWTFLSFTTTIPANTTHMQIGLGTMAEMTTGEVIFSQPQMSLRANAQLIVDGSITADKLAANSVTANAIAANAIEAGMIKAGALDAYTITGATIQTAASGGRIVLSSTNLRGFSGTESNPRYTLSNSGLTFYDTNSTTALVTIDNSGLVATKGTITGATIQTAASGGRIVLGSTNLRGFSGTESNPRYTLSNSGLTFYDTNSTTALVTIDSGGLVATKGTITGATIRTGTSGRRIQMNSSGLQYWNASGQEGSLWGIIDHLNSCISGFESLKNVLGTGYIPFTSAPINNAGILWSTDSQGRTVQTPSTFSILNQAWWWMSISQKATSQTWVPYT